MPMAQLVLVKCFNYTCHGYSSNCTLGGLPELELTSNKERPSMNLLLRIKANCHVACKIILHSYHLESGSDKSLCLQFSSTLSWLKKPRTSVFPSLLGSSPGVPAHWARILGIPLAHPTEVFFLSWEESHSIVCSWLSQWFHNTPGDKWNQTQRNWLAKIELEVKVPLQGTLQRAKTTFRSLRLVLRTCR